MLTIFFHMRRVRVRFVVKVCIQTVVTDHKGALEILASAYPTSDKSHPTFQPAYARIHIRAYRKVMSVSIRVWMPYRTGVVVVADSGGNQNWRNICLLVVTADGIPAGIAQIPAVNYTTLTIVLVRSWKGYVYVRFRPVLRGRARVGERLFRVTTLFRQQRAGRARVSRFRCYPRRMIGHGARKFPTSRLKTSSGALSTCWRVLRNPGRQKPRMNYQGN